MNHWVLLADHSAKYLQPCIDGLSMGALYALIALGYTMVYGIVELINFAHGDVFMLGAFWSLTVLVLFRTTLQAFGLGNDDASWIWFVAFLLMAISTPLFCAGVNWSVDRLIYKPLRNAPKLAPLVSAIGVSFVFMNLGMFWNSAVVVDGVHFQGSADRDFPPILEKLTRGGVQEEGSGGGKQLDERELTFKLKDIVRFGATIPVMIGLFVFVKYTSLGKAMRATAQNPIAAQLMGINTDRVIGATFMLGGALAGVAALIYALTLKTISFQMGFQNGLYAFTAAVLGGIGNIPGAVVGGILIGLIRSLGSAAIGENWTSALVFVVLIVILVFRPTGLFGSRTREKV